MYVVIWNFLLHYNIQEESLLNSWSLVSIALFSDIVCIIETHILFFLRNNSKMEW